MGPEERSINLNIGSNQLAKLTAILRLMIAESKNC
jgi:hypothetical protein